MDIFKSKKIEWWQVGILKLSLLSIGIAIGAQWNSVFAPYISFLVGLGVILGVFMAFVWLKD
jgi:hypothetical protein